MAERGRPPKPVEHHRRVGRSGGKKADGRPLPEPAVVVPLPMAGDTPEPPVELGLEGRRLWGSAWGEAITWLSPQTDMQAVEEACFLVDAAAIARNRYRATTDPADARALVAISKQLTEALSALGFTPVARSRLGVAEVKRVSALEELLQNRRGG